MRSSIGECNCRVLDALAGEFRGCGQERRARHIIGECNCRLRDALAGGFRGRGQESNARHIIGECNCREGQTNLGTRTVQKNTPQVRREGPGTNLGMRCPEND